MSVGATLMLAALFPGAIGAVFTAIALLTKDFSDAERRACLDDAGRMFTCAIGILLFGGVLYVAGA